MNKITVALFASLLLLGTQVHAQNTKTPAALERVMASGEDVTIEVDGERQPLRGRLLSLSTTLSPSIRVARYAPLISAA